MSFKEQKKIMLSKLGKVDRSDKGSIDGRISPLVNLINSKKNYYTTSSCSGRIVLLKTIRRKKPHNFIFRTHNKISSKEIKKQLSVKKKSKEVWFKQEPCILHVVCKNIKDAQDLVDKAKFAGWKRSGIMATYLLFRIRF